MTKQYLKVEISAEDREQADQILNALLAKKLVTGGQIIQAPARFLWKGKIVNMDYCTITSFTIASQKDQIIAEVRSVSVEEVPMVWFTSIGGNDELLRWIEETVGNQ